MSKIIRAIGRPELLDENSKYLNLQKHSEESDRLLAAIDALIVAGRNRVIAYIGPFGSGKTHILDHVAMVFDRRDKRTKKRVDILKFDIWRYADRQQLWEGFVVEVIATLEYGREERHRAMKLAASEVDLYAEGNLTRFVLRHKRIAGFILVSLCVLFSALIWPYLRTDAGNDQLVFLQSLLKYGSGPLLSLVVLLGLDSLLPKPRQLKKIFELEERLTRSLALKKDEAGQKCSLIVIIEDIDRANEEGMVFMETLRNFIDHYNGDRQVIVIAPQSRSYFDVVEKPGVDGFQRSLKIYDTAAYSQLGFSASHEIRDYLERLEVDKAISGRLAEAIAICLGAVDSSFTMRLLKFTIKETLGFLEANPPADFSIAFLLILSRYIPIRNQSGAPQTVASILGTADYHASQQANPFYTAFSMMLGKTASAQRYEIKFGDIEGEITETTREERSSGARIMTISIHYRYKVLVE
jgi:hypothetical protein